jgi:hypothetical protein
MTDKTVPAAAEMFPMAAVGPEWPERPRVRTAKNESGTLTLEGSLSEHEGVAAALASSSLDFQSYCIAQLLGILPPKGTEDFAHHLNAALAMLSAIAPKDELEAMLAVQIIASNHAALEMTGRCIRTDRVDFKATYGNLATKFQRTQIAQVEALDRHRRGGKQIVEHVHVNAGGQAVIAGTVNTGGRGA